MKKVHRGLLSSCRCISQRGPCLRVCQLATSRHIITVALWRWPRCSRSLKPDFPTSLAWTGLVQLRSLTMVSSLYGLQLLCGFEEGLWKVKTWVKRQLSAGLGTLTVHTSGRKMSLLNVVFCRVTVQVYLDVLLTSILNFLCFITLTLNYRFSILVLLCPVLHLPVNHGSDFTRPDVKSKSKANMWLRALISSWP